MTICIPVQNRVTNRTVTNGAAYTIQFGYVQGSSAYGSNATTPLISTITQGSGANALNFSYTYDNRGNITSETRNGVTTTYEYDALGQLTRVNDPNDPTAHNEGGLGNNGTTWIYTYDRGGNILSKAAYEFTTGTVGTAVRTWLYEYSDTNWKDKLTKFDGKTITYDAIGNPLSDGTRTYTWQAGRQLKSMSKTEDGDTITMEFTYNHAGLRTKKIKKVNGIVAETTEYILNGKNVVELIHTNHDTSEVNRLHFYYDAQGRVALVNFNGNLYSYAHNLQGDIIGILDTCGNLVVEYKYDAWGKPTGTTGTLATSLGQLNPFRYRGYVWDRETNLYYLRSRYYCVLICRFLTRDVLLKNGKTYRYANNAPTNSIDTEGNSTRAVLNLYFEEYYQYRDAKDVMRLLIISNGKNTYLAFHEMAQIIAGTYLMDTGVYTSVVLEEAIFREEGGYYEGDISCLGSDGIKYLYEVKPLGSNGTKQLDKYIDEGHGQLKRGKEFIQDFPTNAFENYSIVVASYIQDIAVINYWWMENQRRVRNVEMFNLVRAGVGALAIGILASDDSTIIGVLDNFLMPLIYEWAKSAAY